MDRDRINEIGRQLTQEDYEDLEATVRRHQDYLERIVDLLREQEDELRRLRNGQAARGAVAKY